MNSKIKLFLFAIFYLIIPFVVNAQNDELFILTNKIEEKSKEIDKKNDEIKILEQRIDSFKREISLKKSKNENKSRPTENQKSDNSLIKELQQRLKDLQKILDVIKIDNERLKQEKRNAIREIENLKRDTSVLAKKLNKANEIIKLKKDTIRYLRDVLGCIDIFNRDKEHVSETVIANLATARNDFEKYTKMNKEEKSKNENVIENIIEIYENYKGELKTADCGAYPQSYYASYLTPEDYVIIAKIYGFNYGNAIDRLGENKINKATERLLTSLGYAIEKGHYDQRSESEKLKNDADKMIDNIGSLAIIVKDKSFDLANKFKEVIEFFNNNEFYNSLITYDKYSKFIDLREMKDFQNYVNEAKFCVGTILLWDLYDFKGQPLNKLLRNKWIEGFDSPHELGYDILYDLSVMSASDSKDFAPDEKTIDRHLKKKCIIAIKKLYE